MKPYMLWGFITCQAVRHKVHMRWPQGSILMSLSFSAQILQSWKVEPISQYNSYCSCWVRTHSVSHHRSLHYGWRNKQHSRGTECTLNWRKSQLRVDQLLLSHVDWQNLHLQTRSRRLPVQNAANQASQCLHPHAEDSIFMAVVYFLQTSN